MFVRIKVILERTLNCVNLGHVINSGGSAFLQGNTGKFCQNFKMMALCQP